MKRLLLAPAAVLLLAFAALCQTPRPTPPDEDVVKITTNLVQIDVSVTDRKGNVVRDLKPEDFEIYENGKKQPISAFSFISSVRERAEEAPAKQAGVPVPVPPIALRPEQLRRTVALVVDDLSLSFESTYYTRRALKKFVDEQMQEGDLVAIIRTGAGVGALQQFTTDKRLLYAAIDRVKWNPIGNSNIGAFAALDAVPPPDDSLPEPEPGERTAEGIQREFDDMRSNYFTVGTLGAIDYVVRGLSELPGRKSVVLFSHGFALTNVDAGGFRDRSPVFSSLRRLIDLANRSSVVIYTIDPRGLAITGITAADNTAGRTPEQIRQAQSDRSMELFETQGGLRYLAKETGGFAVVNNNDVSAGVRRVLDDQSYYLVGYDPGDETFDRVTRRYNRIEVKVLRKDLTVRYRSGFFNVEKRDITPPQAAAQTPIQQLHNALMSPFAVGGIGVRLNSLYGNDGRSDFVRSLLHIDAADLKFTDGPNGTKNASFEVLAVSFGDNGRPVEQLGRRFDIKDVRPDTYQRLVRDGFVYNFIFPVKKPGAYQYRVALRDPATGKVGSASQFVEIPNLKKKRLTLSGIVLENVSEAKWAAMEGITSSSAGTPENSIDATDVLNDTSRRVFRTGTILRYGFEIYNAVTPGGQRPQVVSRVRVFRDGKLVFEGNDAAVPVDGQRDLSRLNTTGAITLGAAMPAGDYVLQIVVTDKLAKAKRSIATQFVQFELAR